MADPTPWTEEEAASSTVDAVGSADAYGYEYVYDDTSDAAYYNESAYAPYDQPQEEATYAAYDYGDVTAGGDDDAYAYDADGQPLAVDWSDPNAYAYAYGADGTEGGYAVEADGDASYFEMDEADPNAPTSPFGDEAYWQQYGETDYTNTVNAAYQENEQHGDPHGDEAAVVADQDAMALQVDGEEHSSPPTEPPSDAIVTMDISTPPSVLSSTSSTSKRKKKAGKTKQERVQMRQQLLEKEEADQEEDGDQVNGTNAATTTTAATETATAIAASKSPVKQRGETPRALGFLDRERAKVRLRLRQARAIARKRMPLQLRILTQTRTKRSPLEIYFGGSVEAALSDIFWAATKGDLRRVQFLVEVEHVSVSDCQLDPWHMEQTPLHWAAKGGHGPVVEYLLQAGAPPRVLDETGSMPLHLACWAGHVDATLALLRATDTKDLYIRDYDAALAPLDWANLRGHTQLVRAIEKFEDSKWLPRFVEDLVRGIIRYKIKLFKEPPKPAKSPSRGLHFRRPGGGADEAIPATAAPTTTTAPEPPTNQTAIESAEPPPLQVNESKRPEKPTAGPENRGGKSGVK